MSNPDDVDQFLQRVRTMSDLRDNHDAERVKKLEEELIQGRSERLARRAGMSFGCVTYPDACACRCC